ncbi:ArnT family glycosyltransferase [Lichenicola cladoniae]|uniref:ArnT family glycosyltransferase n=1 Tax=Lichenicola cladoniae TaxID=1484109 RepID=UPI001EF448AA|nr:glycosyltransferase family 39 protein [Lichenicola cladoniae]
MKAWVFALGALTVLRLLVCGFTPISADESYYWVWSRALAPGYLDHPPMTALWIRAGTSMLGSGPIGVRLLAPLSAALGTLLLASAASDLWGGTRQERRRRGIVAAVMLNATLLLGVGSVTMTPDTPLLFFWTLALAALGRVLATGRRGWWLLVGLAIGLALDSKYTAVLTGAGLVLWLLTTRAGRSWLRTPWPWIAGALALLLFAPVLDWNATHGWASFAKQGGRTGAWQPARAGRYLPELLGGQLGLATPFILVLLVAGMIRAVQAGRRGEAGPALLAWVTLLPLAVFVQHALGDRVQANWPGLLYPGAVIAASAGARWWRAASVLGFALVLPVYAQATFAPFPLPRALDVTLQRLAGWPELALAVGRSGPGFIAADEYGLAAELARDLPGRVVLGIEPRWQMFRLPHDTAGEATGLLVRSERRHDAPDPRYWADLVPVGELVRERDGRVAERYRLYRARIRPDLPPDLAVQIARLPAPR